MSSPPGFARLSAGHPATDSASSSGTPDSQGNAISSAATDIAQFWTTLPDDVLWSIMTLGCVLPPDTAKFAAKFLQKCIGPFGINSQPIVANDVLPQVGNLVGMLKCKCNGHSYFEKVLQIVGQFAHENSTAFSNPDHKKWFNDFAQKAGLLDPRTNPLYALEKPLLDKLAVLFPVTSPVFLTNQPGSSRPRLFIKQSPPQSNGFEQLAKAIELVQIKMQYLEGTNPIPNLNDYLELFQDPKVCEKWVNLNSCDNSKRFKSLAALRENFKTLDEAAKTETLYIETVNLLPRFLENIPKHLQTPRIVQAALIKSPDVISHAEPDLINQELILNVLIDQAEILLWMPENLKTEEVYLLAVKTSQYAFSYVPDVYKTQSVCLAAVSVSGLHFRDVPFELKTQELCLAAVQQNGLALEFVPEELRTAEICDAAFQQNELAFRFIPSLAWTKKQASVVVKQDPNGILRVPKELLDEDLVVLAAESHEWFLGDFQVFEYLYCCEFFTPRVCMAAVTKNGRQIFRLPNDQRTLEVYVAAVTEVFKNRDEKFGLEFFGRMESEIHRDQSILENDLEAICKALDACWFTKYPPKNHKSLID